RRRHTRSDRDWSSDVCSSDLIPTPFDPRLIERIAPAVAKAAMESGVASRPLADLEAYRQTMARFMYQSGASMEPVFAAAKVAQKDRKSTRLNSSHDQISYAVF